MGTLYDKAIETKKRNEKLIKDFENQVPVPKDRDKTGLHWQFDEYIPAHNRWNDLKFSVGLCHGYYGNSSCSKESSAAAGSEIKVTLNELKNLIVETTVNRLKKEIVAAMKTAKEEATQVLEEVGA